ncbi:MAG: tail fiber domain-containing protein, partial [Planctomycetota bacterium]
HSANEFRLDANGDTDYRASLATNNGSGYLTFFTGAGTAFLGGTNASTEKVRITAAGNVGIGTTSPTYKLSTETQSGSNYISVEAPLAQQAGFAIRDNTNGTDWLMYKYDLGGQRDLAFWNPTVGQVMTMMQTTGNVGIGTTTPDTLLVVNANGAISGGAASTHGAIQIVGGADINSGSNGLEFKAASGTSGYGWLVTSPDRGGGNVPLSFASRNGSSSWTERLTLRSETGNVGIGTTSPRASLDIGGGTQASLAIGNGGYLYTYGGGVNTTDIRAGVQLDGTGQSVNFYTANTYRGGVGATGNLTVIGSGTTCVIGSGTGATNCTSDARLKTNIVAITGEEALQKLALIRGVTFNWLDPSKDQEQRVGVIAQDVQAAFPQVVGQATTTLGGVEGSYLTVDYAALVAPLISAVNELFSKVNALANIVAGFAHELITDRVVTKELCVAKADGTLVCLTGDQLAAIGTAGSVSAPVATSTPDTVGPVITLNGANPAHIDIGATYIDLGATVTDNVDQNLGYKVSLGGATSTDPSALVLDTSTSTTHIITYSATDQA